MPRELVNCAADVEQLEPDCHQHPAAIAGPTATYIARSVESEGMARAVRDAHVRGIGLTRAMAEIHDDLPASRFR